MTHTPDGILFDPERIWWPLGWWKVSFWHNGGSWTTGKGATPNAARHDLCTKLGWKSDGRFMIDGLPAPSPDWTREDWERNKHRFVVSSFPPEVDE